MTNRHICLLLLVACAAFAPGSMWAASGADLIVVNGHVYTADPKSREFSAANDPLITLRVPWLPKHLDQFGIYRLLSPPSNIF